MRRAATQVTEICRRFQDSYEGQMLEGGVARLALRVTEVVGITTYVPGSSSSSSVRSRAAPCSTKPPGSSVGVAGVH